MELLVDVLLRGLGYVLVKAFNSLFRAKVAFGDGGYIVTGFLFMASLVAIPLLLINCSMI